MLKVKIGGLQKSSLIDYPEKLSAIIFTQGCNFRCPYCHNPELISLSDANNNLSASDILNFLKTRIGKLDGVVITGGEPTLQKDLPEFIKEIKGLGFTIKLDTNGTNPAMLDLLVNDGLIDYVAMDIKSSIDNYSKVVCNQVCTENILKSIDILKNSSIGFEFRTTVVKSQLSFSDFEKIGELIEGAQKYYLQKFVPTKALDESFISESTYTDEEFVEIVKILEKYVREVHVR